MQPAAVTAQIETDGDADPGEPRGLSDDQPRQIPASGAEGGADGDLPAALIYGERQQAIHAGRGEEQRQHAGVIASVPATRTRRNASSTPLDNGHSPIGTSRSSPPIS